MDDLKKNDSVIKCMYIRIRLTLSTLQMLTAPVQLKRHATAVGIQLMVVTGRKTVESPSII